MDGCASRSELNLAVQTAVGYEEDHIRAQISYNLLYITLARFRTNISY